MSSLPDVNVPPGFVVNAEKIILEPYNYICQGNGKGMRAELLAAFNHWLHVPQSVLVHISEVVQMLHNASLIVDDIEDGSILRRGIPTAHCVFGVPTSINSANYVYFLALQKLFQLQNPDCLKIFTEQMLELHRGQGMDIFWRCAYKCPTEEEYKAMVICKTGGLFGLGVRLMQLFSNVKTDFKPLLDRLGLFYQIRDDYANLIDNSYHKAKTFAEDLTEGKFSYPIVRAIQDNPEDNQVMNILYQRTTSNSLKRQCIKHIIELGTLTHTVEVLANLETECKDLIEKYGANPLLEKFVCKLSNIYKNSDGELNVLNLEQFEKSQIE